MHFRSTLSAILAVISIAMFAAANADAADSAKASTLRLWRLDCGEIQVNDLNAFSDSFAYTGRSMRLVASCYLIQHGDHYMMWDTGFPTSDLGKKFDGSGAMSDRLNVTLVDQLKTLGLTPAQVTEVGISHYHSDHTGQAQDFPQARLLLGRGDVDVLRQPDNERAKPLAHWLTEGGKLDAVDGDRDVYGDGSVLMLNLPGHTPGHHGLLVKLPKTGYVLLSGDAAHLRDNYDSNGVPPWNVDRAASLASMDRIHAIVAHTHATFVIQHDSRDVAKLPAFPKAAE